MIKDEEIRDLTEMLRVRKEEYEESMKERWNNPQTIIDVTECVLRSYSFPYIRESEEHLSFDVFLNGTSYQGQFLWNRKKKILYIALDTGIKIKNPRQLDLYLYLERINEEIAFGHFETNVDPESVNFKYSFPIFPSLTEKEIGKYLLSTIEIFRYANIPKLEKMFAKK